MIRKLLIIKLLLLVCCLGWPNSISGEDEIAIPHDLVKPLLNKENLKMRKGKENPAFAAFNGLSQIGKDGLKRMDRDSAQQFFLAWGSVATYSADQWGKRAFQLLDLDLADLEELSDAVILLYFDTLRTIAAISADEVIIEAAASRLISFTPEMIYSLGLTVAEEYRQIVFNLAFLLTDQPEAITVRRFLLEHLEKFKAETLSLEAVEIAEDDSLAELFKKLLKKKPEKAARNLAAVARLVAVAKAANSDHLEIARAKRYANPTDLVATGNAWQRITQLESSSGKIEQNFLIGKISDLLLTDEIATRDRLLELGFPRWMFGDKTSIAKLPSLKKLLQSGRHSVYLKK